MKRQQLQTVFVAGKVFVVHGGLPRAPDCTLAQIEALDHVREPPAGPANPDDALYFDMLWSDPHDGNGIVESSRGAGTVLFGADVTKSFLKRNSLELCIR